MVLDRPLSRVSLYISKATIRFAIWKWVVIECAVVLNRENKCYALCTMHDVLLGASFDAFGGSFFYIASFITFTLALYYPLRKSEMRKWEMSYT